MHSGIGARGVLLLIAAASAGCAREAPSPIVWQTPPPSVHRAGRVHPLPITTSVVVYVAGRVAKPGLLTLPGSARVADAVAQAGGVLANADLAAANPAQHLLDGETIIVPAIGEVAAPRSRATPRTRAPHRRRARVPRLAPREQTLGDAELDVNVEPAESLALVPGIGPALARRIVEYRNANGAFGSLDELLDVNGMTDARLTAAQPFLVVR